MRKPFFKFLHFIICLSFFGSIAVFADNNMLIKNQETLFKKTYVQPADIRFHEKKLYVFLNDGWSQTNAIYVDQYGPYVESWTCSRCGINVTSNPWSCDACGKRRD